MKYLFFINPKAGKGVAQEKIVESIKSFFEECKKEYEIHLTRFKGDAEAVAREKACKGEPIIMFACGGEGTCYEVLNGIAGFDNVSLGVIPCGSANDFLKFFENKEPFYDVRSQIEGEAVPMDLIKAGDRYCLNGCSVGMDAMVANDMSIFKGLPLVSGPLAYKLAIAKVFFNKLGVSVKLSLDDEDPKDLRCLFAVIANGPVYGGGYKSAPNAVPFDGRLDFTLVDVVSRIKVLKFLKDYEKGTHGKYPFCHLKNCTSMEFSSDAPIPVNLDGEIVLSKNMRFEIVKSAIKFIIPKGVNTKLLTKV